MSPSPGLVRGTSTYPGKPFPTIPPTPTGLCPRRSSPDTTSGSKNGTSLIVRYGMHSNIRYQLSSPEINNVPLSCSDRDIALAPLRSSRSNPCASKSLQWRLRGMSLAASLRFPFRYRAASPHIKAQIAKHKRSFAVKQTFEFSSDCTSEQIASGVIEKHLVNNCTMLAAPVNSRTVTNP